MKILIFLLFLLPPDTIKVPSGQSVTIESVSSPTILTNNPVLIWPENANKNLDNIDLHTQVFKATGFYDTNNTLRFIIIDAPPGPGPKPDPDPDPDPDPGPDQGQFGIAPLIYSYIITNFTDKTPAKLFADNYLSVLSQAAALPMSMEQIMNLAVEKNKEILAKYPDWRKVLDLNTEQYKKNKEKIKTKDDFIKYHEELAEGLNNAAR